MYIRVITGQNDDRYRAAAADLSETVARIVDKEKYIRVRDHVLEIYDRTENKVMSNQWGSDEWNEYTALFSEVENSEDFITLRESIRNVQDVNSVDCVYLSYLDAKNERFIYIVDGAYEDACPPGCLDEVFDINRGLLEDPTIGFPAYITDTEEYGWLVTAGAPIYSESGEVIGYSMVDISMQEVRDTQTRSIVRLLVYLLIAVLIICVLGIIIINRLIVRPIRILTDAAVNYSKNYTGGKNNYFANVDINTGDEIEALSESIKQMENELNTRIEELTSTNEKLDESRHEVHEMTILANNDGLTGVGNKTSYNNYVASLEQDLRANRDIRFGIAMVDLNYLKKINDTYGHESGDAAIIRLSHIICSVFADSPIFRIGGDEFVIVLKNHDYEHVEELVEEFEKKITASTVDADLPPQDRVSAAIGYALFDPEIDKGVSDVFKRADEEMYENKRNFKGKIE
ncbi:MAG: diguanylate cyclase [Clostridia bacterium]|nr:diguanylate cyclase [Clostridia bacterium]